MRTSHLYLCILLIAFPLIVNAQVAINETGADPDPYAILDVQSDSKALIVPRMTTAQRTTLASNASDGMIVYDTDLDAFYLWDGSWAEVSPGYWSRDAGNGYLYHGTSTDKIGIGTSTPAYKLDIELNSVSGVSQGIRIMNSNVGDAFLQLGTSGINRYAFGIDNSDNDNLKIGEGNTLYAGTILTITRGTRRVGIGTTAPSTLLEVNGTVTATAFDGDGSALTNIPGDDLGDHSATQNLFMDGHWITNDGDDEGIFVQTSGYVGIGTSTPASLLDVNGTLTATAFSGDGSALTNVPGDDLGDHTATQNISLDGNYISNDGDNEGIYINNSGLVGIGTNGPTAPLMVTTSMLGTPAIRASNTHATGGTGTYAIWASIGCTSNNIAAIYGQHTASSGSSSGLHGSSNSSTGHGVSGYANHTTGNNVGVYGKTSSSNGHAGFFDGRVYSSGDLGVGIQYPVSKLDVDGAITMRKMSSNPSPLTSPLGPARLYVKGDYLVVQHYVNSSTTNYYYLDLTAASGTWQHSTTAP